MADHVEVKKSSGHISSLFSPKVRAYLYGVMLVCSPVAIYYGLATAEEAGLWIVVIGAILGVSNGLALSNVPGVTKSIKETTDG